MAPSSCDAKRATRHEIAGPVEPINPDQPRRRHLVYEAALPFGGFLRYFLASSYDPILRFLTILSGVRTGNQVPEAALTTEAAPRCCARVIFARDRRRRAVAGRTSGPFGTTGSEGLSKLDADLAGQS